jgi:dienelactone hydrolase
MGPAVLALIAISVLALSASCAAAGTKVEGMKVAYEVDGMPVEGYYIEPSPGAPLVLLVHDWDGLTDYEIKRSEMLAELGYAVFAVDLFGTGVRPTKFEEKRRITSGLYADRPRMRTLLFGGIKAAESKGAAISNAVVMGYCFGGGAVLELARSGADFKGFVTFHGVLSKPEGQNYSQTRGQVLVFHGTADQSVSMDDFAQLARDLEKAGVHHEMTTYGGAPHAFTVFGAESYREDADRKSWRRFTEFLAETLAPQEAKPEE